MDAISEYNKKYEFFKDITGEAMKVHRKYHGGLLESAYEAALKYLLELKGRDFRGQEPPPPAIQLHAPHAHGVRHAHQLRWRQSLLRVVPPKSHLRRHRKDKALIIFEINFLIILSRRRLRKKTRSVCDLKIRKKLNQKIIRDNGLDGLNGFEPAATRQSQSFYNF